MTTRPTVVWTEIPVTNLEKATEFYAKLFGWEMQRDDTGPNPIVTFTADESGVSGHLYPGKPANGNSPTVHLAVPGVLEDAMAACADLGGGVVSPVITIPPGRFAYATDPDGNSLGLFQPAAA